MGTALSQNISNVLFGLLGIDVMYGGNGVNGIIPGEEQLVPDWRYELRLLRLILDMAKWRVPDIPVQGFPHNYTTIDEICDTQDPNCTVENVYQCLRKHPAPGMQDNQIPVDDFDIEPADLGLDSIHDDFGRVIFTKDDQLKTVTNTTILGHVLHPGVITRTVNEDPVTGKINIDTQGSGTGAFPISNVFLSKPMWDWASDSIRNCIDNL